MIKMTPNEWYKYGFKTVLVLVCFALFLANSWETFITYKKGQTMESVTIVTPTDKMMVFPNIIICPVNAYQNTSKVMLSIEDYEENTINPEIYLDDLAWMIKVNHTVQSATKKMVEDVEKNIIFTVYHGRCLSLHYPHKVRAAKQFLVPKIKEPRKVILYVLRPGEEIYLIHAWFPYFNPTTLQVSDNQYDVILSYQVHNGAMDQLKNGICTEDTECLKETAASLIQKSSCTLPWHWKLVNNGSTDAFRLCSKDKFFAQGQDPVRSTLEHFGDCKYTCPWTRVKAVSNPTNVKVHPCMMGWLGGNCSQMSPFTDTALLYIGFVRADIELITKVPRIDFNMFVNAIGGGLGLFMGFSIINLFFMAYEGVLKMGNYFKSRKSNQISSN